MVIHYIATQKEHHRRYTLETELRTLLSEHGCAIDEKYFMNDND